MGELPVAERPFTTQEYAANEERSQPSLRSALAPTAHPFGDGPTEAMAVPTRLHHTNSQGDSDELTNATSVLDV